MDLQRQILDTSSRLLVAMGYERLSLRRIAREIGISATSIYLYFGSKDALFEALVEEGMHRLQMVLEAESTRSPTSLDAYRRMCRAYLEFGFNNPEYYEIMFIFRSDLMRRFPPEKYRKARRNFHLFQRVVEDVTALGKEDSRILTAAIWMTLHGIVSLVIGQRLDIGIDREKTVSRALEGLDALIISRMPPLRENLSEAPPHLIGH